MLKIFKDKITQDFMKISFGNILEWYDFSIYGLFAIQIAKAFFPKESGFIALFMVFLTFAAGFVARPLGSLIFGYIGDTHGKHYAVNLSIWCMAIPTIIVGFLPDYHKVGIIAPVSLVTLRILQGLSTGGQFSGLLTIAVDSKAPHKTFLVSLVYAISVLGTLIASIIGLCFISFSNKYSELSDMIWRFPFILSGILFLIYLKLRPKFKKIQLDKEQTFSFKQIFLKQPKELIFAIIISTTTGILYYVLFIYLITYLQLHLHIDKKYSFLFMNFILFVSIILYAFFGYQGHGKRAESQQHKNIFTYLLAVYYSYS